MRKLFVSLRGAFFATKQSLKSQKDCFAPLRSARNDTKKRGQSTLEFTILTIIIIGVFLSAGNYVKRGIQGRWKSAVDDLGDQYDPRTANTTLNSAFISNSDMRISIMNVTDGGVVTFRNDDSESVETKQGSVLVGPLGM